MRLPEFTGQPNNIVLRVLTGHTDAVKHISCILKAMFSRNGCSFLALMRIPHVKVMLPDPMNLYSDVVH